MSNSIVNRWMVSCALLLPPVVGCVAETPPDEYYGANSLAPSVRTGRYAKIRDAAASRGMRNAFLLAGIANDETGLAMCWSEATWACQGPSSPDCGGGPIIAGSGDGPCSLHQGGLGMFQFDAGTFDDTLKVYGSSVLTIDGQVSHAINYVTRMVRDSAYTYDAETDEKARQWINDFDVGNATLRDQWIRTVVRYYNGCQPGWSCWSSRYSTYSDGLNQALNDTGGVGFWNASSGTRCDGFAGTTVGAIDEKYRSIGGCGSVIGAPLTNETTTPDGVGRYNVFERGSIYWTDKTGAHEVHGKIRDEWKVTGWEAGTIGYPITDELKTPDGIGRYNVFERGSIYWTEKTGAHEVHGRIRDAWKDAGWEAGSLGYPISDEYAVDGGKKSDFERGSITWKAATNETSVTLTP